MDRRRFLLTSLAGALAAPLAAKAQQAGKVPKIGALLRRALQLRRQIAREGWWNLTPGDTGYVQLT